MRMKLVMNPSARSGRGRGLWEEWLAGLRSAGCELETVITYRPGDGINAARETVGDCTVVAVGGDGTINEVLDGIMQSSNHALIMGVLYCGTSPDFCRFHQIPVAPRAALEALLRGRTNLVDVCRIRYQPDCGGEALTAHFGCGCNIGLGAAVAGFANRGRKWLGDRFGTGLGVMRAIAGSKPLRCTLCADNETLRLDAVNHLAVLKSPYIASGLKLDIALRPADGRIALVVISGLTRRGLCGLLPGFYSGKAAASPAVMLKTCRTVAVETDIAHSLEFDGDPRGGLPVSIDLLPRALKLTGGVI